MVLYTRSRSLPFDVTRTSFQPSARSHCQCFAVPLFMQHTGLEVCYSQDGRHLPDHVPDECDIVFVLEEFSGPVFDQLRSAGLR